VQGAGNIKEHLLLPFFGFLNKDSTRAANGPPEFQVIHALWRQQFFDAYVGMIVCELTVGGGRASTYQTVVGIGKECSSLLYGCLASVDSLRYHQQDCR